MSKYALIATASPVKPVQPVQHRYNVYSYLITAGLVVNCFFFWSGGLFHIFLGIHIQQHGSPEHPNHQKGMTIEKKEMGKA